MLAKSLIFNMAMAGQVFNAKGLRHPSAGLHLSAGSIFVPNDVELGGGQAPFIILTGANMGGQSLFLPSIFLWERSLSGSSRTHSAT